MVQLRSKILTFLCLGIFLNTQAEETELTKYITHKYVTSNFESTPTEQKQENETPKDNPLIAHLKQAYKIYDPKLHTFTPQELFTDALNITSHHENFSTSVIDKSVIDKLEIVGGGEKTQSHLFGSIFKNYIHTRVGTAQTILTLCHPTTDIRTLKRRQTLISTLNKDKPLLKNINTTLTATKINESSFLMIASTTNQPINEEAAFSYLPGATISPLAAFKTSTTAVFLSNLPGEIMYGLMPVLVPIVAVGTYTIGKQNPYFLAGIIESVGLTYLSYGYFMKKKTENSLIKSIQKILIDNAQYIKSLKELGELLNKKQSLIKIMPSLQPLADLAAGAKNSDKLNKLLGMLETNTFVGDPSFFSITSRVLATYALMKEVKNELIPAIAAAGELDMYLACARLYNSRAGKDNRYCFAQFSDDKMPVLEAKNFWNPFINPDTVVPNDAVFNSQNQNILLTGPNTGGKSTILKGLMINVLMAETFGMAPAESLTLTPYSKLNCFMNISDDIATGASLFKSEVMRAKALVDTIESLGRNQFSFIIIDEVFTGTSPKEGEAAAFQFAKKIGGYPNSTSIIATHYPKLIDLEKETNGLFKNFHIEVLRNPDGTLNRTFKLKRGPSLVNVAFDILEEEGLVF